MKNKRGAELGKFVLFFQAAATLIIGIVFFMQLLQLQAVFSEKIDGLSKMNSSLDVSQIANANTNDLEFRFKTASYILIVISLIEIIIISRFYE